jgi:hypothetical protein
MVSAAGGIAKLGQGAATDARMTLAGLILLPITMQ